MFCSSYVHGRFLPKSALPTSMGGIQVVLLENVVLEFGILVSSRCTTSLESCATKVFHHKSVHGRFSP